ncbi:MAG: hypothetical protein ACYDFT_04105 [Thermoplasmata archaeon]
MNARSLAGPLAVVAVGFASLSYASEGGGLMIPLGAAAGASAAALVALALAGRLAPAAPPPPAALDGEPERLRVAMDSGLLGRKSVIARLRALGRGAPEVRSSLSSEEEARVLRLAQREFLLWVEARLEELEAAP